MQANRGFTLLEVLVAISIFAVIGLGANQMLRTVIDTHEKTTEKVESMATLTRAFGALERDLGQAVPRFVRDEFGDPLPPLMVSTGPYLLELSRTGWSNPISLPRSNLQRVAYDLNDEGDLVRRFWLVLDRAEDSEPIEQTVLRGVEDFSVNLLVDDEGQTTNLWPDSDYERLLPRAVEIVLQTQKMGELRKVYNLVDLIGVRNTLEGEQGDNTDLNGSNSQADDQVDTRDAGSITPTDGRQTP